MEKRITYTNLDPSTFRDLALGEFLRDATLKFDRGQAEKQDCIVDRVTLKEVKEELIDAVFYVKALELKLKSLGIHDI